MPKVINAKKAGFINYAYSNGVYYPQKQQERKSNLEPGIYEINCTQDGQIFFQSVSTLSDDLIDLPDFISTKIIREINKFWSPDVKSRYARYGMVYKRGILLHGKQGTGKTSIITRVMEEHVENGGIVLFCPSPGLLKDGSKIIREIEGDKNFLIIYEELDRLLDSNESGFLSLLDGEDQIENVVYVATTNYLNRIPPRIRNRPSRFASIIEVGTPNEATRRAFLSAKVKDENFDVDLWVKVTDGMVIDQLKDLIVSVFCIGIKLDDAVQKILDMGAFEEEHQEEDESRHSKRRLYEQLFGR